MSDKDKEAYYEEVIAFIAKELSKSSRKVDPIEEATRALTSFAKAEKSGLFKGKRPDKDKFN